MKKTVKYNGGNIQVDFETSSPTRVITLKDKCGLILKAHGTRAFMINGKSYPTQWTINKKCADSKSSTFLYYNDYKADSEKKIIEHILSIHGL
jgi:hypothetical protein